MPTIIEYTHIPHLRSTDVLVVLPSCLHSRRRLLFLRLLLSLHLVAPMSLVYSWSEFIFASVPFCCAAVNSYPSFSLCSLFSCCLFRFGRLFSKCHFSLLLFLIILALPISSLFIGVTQSFKEEQGNVKKRARNVEHVVAYPKWRFSENKRIVHPLRAQRTPQEHCCTAHHTLRSPSKRSS